MSLGKLHKKSKFVNINLREKFVSNSSRFLSSGMDISDGLFSDLAKLGESSRVGYKFLSKIVKNQGCSGEEYEMLISFNPRYKKAIIRRSLQTRTPIKIFAIASRVKYTNRCKAHHFKG
jgi:thiamine-monophosphate kinase